MKVVYREVSRLTVDEWRSDPELVRMAAKVLSEPAIRNMLDVLRNSHLARYGTPGMTMEGRAIHQAQIEGYNTALNNFEALAIELKKHVELESTFEPMEFEKTV